MGVRQGPKTQMRVRPRARTSVFQFSRFFPQKSQSKVFALEWTLADSHSLGAEGSLAGSCRERWDPGLRRLKSVTNFTVKSFNNFTGRSGATSKSQTWVILVLEFLFHYARFPEFAGVLEAGSGA